MAVYKVWTSRANYDPDSFVGDRDGLFFDEEGIFYLSDGATPGGIQLGSGGGGDFVLRTATSDRLGGVKIGDNINVTNGVISIATPFSGNYADLSNKPTLFSGNYADLTNKPDLSVYQLTATAFSGDYSDLSNKPTLPTDLSDLTDNTNLLQGTGDGESFTLSTATNDILGGVKIGAGISINGSGVISAFDGNYENLSNKPTIPSVISDLENDTGFITDYTVIESDVIQHQSALSISESQISDLQSYLTSVSFSDITEKPTTISGYGITDAFNGDYSSLSNKPTLFSGDYADLSNKPTLFSGDYADLSNKPTLFSGAYADLTEKPDLSVYALRVDVPSDISELTDNSNLLSEGDITEADVFAISMIL